MERPRCDAYEYSRCNGSRGDILSRDERADLAAAGRFCHNKKARAERRCLALRAGASRCVLVDRSLRLHSLFGSRVEIEAARPDFACMGLMINRNPPAGVCPAKPELKA